MINLFDTLAPGYRIEGPEFAVSREHPGSPRGLAHYTPSTWTTTTCR